VYVGSRPSSELKVLPKLFSYPYGLGKAAGGGGMARPKKAVSYCNHFDSLGNQLFHTDSSQFYGSYTYSSPLDFIPS